MHWESRPFFLTPVSHLFVVAQTPSQDPLFRSPRFPAINLDFLYLFFSFLSTTLRLLSAASVSLCPLIYLKARPAGFGYFPRSPERPGVFTPGSSLLSLGLSAGREKRGALVWRVGPQMDIDMSGMCYVVGLGSGLPGHSHSCQS